MLFVNSTEKKPGCLQNDQPQLHLLIIYPGYLFVLFLIQKKFKSAAASTIPPEVVNSYINYWEAEEAKWHELIRVNSDIVTAGQSNQYQVLKRIIPDLGTLLYLLSDVYSLSKDQLFANDFVQIKTAINTSSQPGA